MMTQINIGEIWGVEENADQWDHVLIEYYDVEDTGVNIVTLQSTQKDLTGHGIWLNLNEKALSDLITSLLYVQKMKGWKDANV